MPTPSGSVYLCSNALIDKTYNHTIDFKSPEEQLSYWGSLIKYTVSEVSYIRRQRPYIAVDYSLDELKEVNYLFYRAEEDSKIYFAFVTSKEYFADRTTYIYFETDVLQTYLFDFNIKQSYVLQEHCDRWTVDHKPIYSRTEEGLDYGSEYTVENAYAVADPDKSVRWYVAICTKHEELVKSGNSSLNNTQINGQAHPYVLYLLPGLGRPLYTTDEVFTFKNKSSILGEGGASTVSGILGFTELMANSELGNSVIQIIKLPYMTLDLGVNDSTIEALGNNLFTITELGSDTKNYNFIKINMLYLGPKELAEMSVFEGIESAMPTEEQWVDIKANPYTTERDKRFESKLLTYPYRYNMLTDWRSTPQIFKNEYLAGDKITLGITAGVSVNSPTRYFIKDYKKELNGRQTSVTQAVSEEQPVINSEYYSYLLANRNQIQANETNARIGAIGGAATGLIGGFMGGWAGAGIGLLSGGISGGINAQAVIRTENAKQKDLRNLPDTITNSNDGLFNVIDANEWLTFYRFKICCEFEELLADTFAMTGYTVKRVKVPNLKSRLRFNYIKTVGANIVGSFDQNDLATIKEIFDKGITFWHYSTTNFKPFDYSLENIETNLL